MQSSFLVTVVLLAVSGIARADNLIAPGQRIGVIRIGMTASELYKAAGEPSHSSASLDSRMTFYNYGGQFDSAPGAVWGLEAQCWDGRVRKVLVHDPKYKTAQGIGVGDSQLALFAKMGKGTAETGDAIQGGISYKYRGIYFFVRDGRVHTIGVTAR